MTASHQCICPFASQWRLDALESQPINNTVSDHVSSTLETFNKESEILPVSEFHPKLYIRSSLALFIETNAYNSGSQHTVSAWPRNLVKMPILRLHPRPTEPETKWGPSTCVSPSPPGGSETCWSLRTTGLQIQLLGSDWWPLPQKSQTH